MVIWCSGGKTFKTRRQHGSDVLRGVWLVLASAAQLRDLFGACSAPARLTCLSRILTESWWDRGGQREKRLTCILHVPTMAAGGHRLYIQPREVGSTSGHTVHTKSSCIPAFLLCFPRQFSASAEKKYTCLKIPFVIGQPCYTGKSSVIFYFPH